MTVEYPDQHDRFNPDSVGGGSFAHTVDALRVLETHISWVFLTGKFAYKVKKPLKLDFLDFSTLEKRHYYCDEELRLNAGLVSGLYIAVVPIGGSPAEPRFGTEPAFEYAVKMHQFEQSARLDHLLAAGDLTAADAVDLGQMLARMHATAAVADNTSEYGSVRSVIGPITDNYRLLFKRVTDPVMLKRLRTLCTKDISRLRQLRAVLSQRRRRHKIRECHGDLHLANLVKFDSQVAVFDCLEFDPALRWIDVMNDVAFVYMDLIDHQAYALAFEFLNAYLESSGDYDGLEVIDLYATYRAMVRMKIAALSPAHAGQERQSMLMPYLSCAEYFSTAKKPLLVIMRGLSASGKSWLSGRLLALLPAVRLRSDVERKRAAGLHSTQKSHSDVGAGLYSPEMTRQTYERMRSLARTVLSSGYTVIIDAANLKQWQRAVFVDLAAASGVPAVIVECHAPEALLRRRIEQRKSSADNVSEADQRVLDVQLNSAEPLSSDERAISIEVDTSQDLDAAVIAGKIVHPGGRPWFNP